MNQGVARRVLPDVPSSPDASPAVKASATTPDVDESGRLATLRSLMLLDTAPEAEYDDLVALASEICQTPIALVSLVDEDRQWFKAKVGLEASATPREHAFCSHAIAAPGGIFSVSDATADVRFASNPLVTQDPRIRFYAGVPIVTDDGQPVGTVCVIDTKPRTLSASQERCLKTLARQAAGLLNLRRTAAAATRAALDLADLTAEARLKQEKGSELLELVLQGRDLGLWDLDVPSGRWTASAQELRMLGFGAGDSRDLDWRELIHPDDLGATTASMGPHLRGETPHYECTHRMRRRDGCWVWMLSRAVVVQRDAAGVPVRIVGTHMDITEQRRLDTERRESAARLELEMVRRRVLLDHASEYVFVLSRSLHLTEANPRFAAGLGYTLDEILQLRPWQWDAIDDDRAKFIARWPSWASGPWTAETQWRRKDGTVLDVEMSCTCVSFAAQEEYLFVCRDITEARRNRIALEQARDLLEQTAQMARIGGWEVDLVATTVTWSSEVYRIHGVTDPDWRPTLRSSLEFYPPEARPVITAAVDAAIADGTTYDLQLPLVTASGRRIWVRIQGHAEYEGGRAVRLVGMFQDVSERKVAEDALVASERRLRLITDNMPCSIMHIDRDERYCFVNRHFGGMFGLQPESILGLQMRDLCSVETYASLAPRIARALAGEATQFEWSTPLSGTQRHFQSHYVPDVEADGHVAGFYALVLDITGRKQAELKSVASERLLRGITDNLPACIAEVDREGRYRFANATYLDWTGVEPAAMIGRNVAEAILPEFYELRRDAIARALRGERVCIEQTIVLRKGRRTVQSTYLPHFDEEHNVAGLYALTSDITELKDTQRQLAALARLDTLTDLPNRRHFEERAAETLARARRSGRIGALFYLDVDRFKSVNDSLGHAGGDELLQEFARRLTHALRETDFVARYAGDEFVAIAEGIAGEAEARMLAEKIAASVRRPFSLTNACVNVTTSIGIALFDRDETLRSLLERADQALYASKSAGRDTIHVSSPEALVAPA